MKTAVASSRTSVATQYGGKMKEAIWPEHQPWRLLWVGDKVYVETDIFLEPMPGRLAVRLCEEDEKLVNDAIKASARSDAA